MSEPVSLFHVRDHSRDLAFSALPSAPVRTARRRSVGARHLLARLQGRIARRG
jgi:hypothetical protein